MTKTPETVKIYLFRGKKLWARAANYYGISKDELLATDYLNWLETILGNLMPATRRQYIAASRELLQSLKISKFPPTATTHDLEKAIKKVMVMTSGDYSDQYKQKQKPRRRKTSSQKSKRLDIEDIKLLKDATKDSKSQWVLPGLLWLSANIAVGLRPCEWRYSQLITIDSKPHLKVCNGKHTNGRAHGETRHIDLSGLMQIEMIWLELQLRTAQQYSDTDAEWDHYYNAVRRTIHAISRQHLGNRRKFPTLYSSRHQFAANAKQEGLAKEEIGALMGHASANTATQHYGRKIYGKGGCRSRPVEDEVDKVKPAPFNNTKKIKGH